MLIHVVGILTRVKPAVSGAFEVLVKSYKLVMLLPGCFGACFL